MDENDIKTDLTAGKGRPEWVFSCYGPGKNAPRQLFGGPQREQSFEEMRVRHYQAAAAGNIDKAIQEAQACYADALRQNEVALNDLSGAVKYIIDGANEHPNRIDITEGKTGGFGQAPQAQPAQPAQPAQGPAFGQPAGMGGQHVPSPFGQPSALGQGGAFGRPSALGSQPAFGQPSFGQAGFSRPAGQPAFGQPSFGQPSAPGPSGFGQPSTAASPFNPIAKQNQQPNAFGQPSAPQTNPPFGQPSAQAAPTGFGQGSQPTPLGQPQPSQPPHPSAFNQPSPFGAPQQPQAQQPQPFGQPAPSGPAQPAAIPPDQLGVNGRKKGTFIRYDPKELDPLPLMTGQTVRDPMTNKLTAWKGQPVKYIKGHACYLHPQDGKSWIRIIYPDGPPDPASLKDAQAKPEEYTPEITAQYDFFFTHGYFKDGVIPPIPPKTEWLDFEF